jgi:hypothetical protein
MFSRGEVLAVSAAGAMMATAARAASCGNPDLPPQGAINAKGPGNLEDHGLRNLVLGKQFPSAQFPRMGVFNTGPNIVTTDFAAGDIGYVKRNYRHYVEITGDTDLVFLGVFRAPRYQEVSLSNWLAHTPAALVAQHLNVDPATIAKWPSNSPGVMPA